ncbi:MAG: hypothetical protein H7A45_04220 [Verrucomicrobiales bacterium]|nr:hypothetical protein [Verrucomicrobiales bacterium]MCP5528455.1 hypothetical protein [Verrucomicrobiales bacterium]
MNEKPASKPASSGRSSSRANWTRFVMVPLLVGSVVLMWWSVRRLAPLQNEQNELAASISGLESEVDEMQSELDRGGGQAGIEDCYRQAQAQLIEGRTGVEEWLGALDRAGQQFALDIATSFGNPEPLNLTNHPVTIVPASLNVVPRRDLELPRSPYQRILDLAELINTGGKRIDLVQLQAQGHSNSVDNAQLQVRLWVTELQTAAP